MRQVTSRVSSVVTVVEVDGNLDAVSAYDLHRCIDTAVRRGARQVGVDLSRVASMDEDGVHGLLRCCSTAIAAGVALTLTSCSRSSIEAIKCFSMRETQRRR